MKNLVSQNRTELYLLKIVLVLKARHVWRRTFFSIALK